MSSESGDYGTGARKIVNRHFGLQWFSAGHLSPCGGVANRFNKQKKSQRSYYPLHRTCAQTSQVLAVLHRSGNDHDSREAQSFIQNCVEYVQDTCLQARIEMRMYGTFFGEQIIRCLKALCVEYQHSLRALAHHPQSPY